MFGPSLQDPLDGWGEDTFEENRIMKETKRVQFEMPAKSYERLSRLKHKTEATTHAEVIRRSLQLYEALIDETEKGKLVSVKSEDGSEVLYKPIFRP